MGVFLPATTLCEDDDGDGEVIPAQLPVNDRQIDDVVEELIKDGHDVSNLRPLLGLHGAPRNLHYGESSQSGYFVEHF